MQKKVVIQLVRQTIILLQKKKRCHYKQKTKMLVNQKMQKSLQIFLRNHLLPADAFAEKMGHLGVDTNTTVIVYDVGNVIWSARIWWALRYYGHDRVFVLEGGAAAWQEAGLPWTSEVIQPPPKTFVPRERPQMRALKAQVHTAIDDPTVTIIETRREAGIREAGGTVQGAYWLPSTTVFAPKGAYQALIPEAELDHYLRQIGVDESAHMVAT